MDIARDILVGLLIATVSAWVTVQLSLKRFRSEKWWERKVEAYERVIEALHHRKAFADAHYEEWFEGQKHSQERQDQLSRGVKESIKEIEKAANVGAFLFSGEAQGRLARYKRESREALKGSDIHEMINSSSKAVDSCLSDLIELARKDLRIK